MLSDDVFTEGVTFKLCNHIKLTLTLKDPLVLNVQQFDKPEATSSQAGEVTQLTEFPWRFFPSILSELVYYGHLVLSERVITFVTISQLVFMLNAFMHSKSTFLGACFITWVAFHLCFLHLYVICFEVRSHSKLFGTYILAAVTFLLSLDLRQPLLYGSYVSLLEHLNSQSSHWNSWSL